MKRFPYRPSLGMLFLYALIAGTQFTFAIRGLIIYAAVYPSAGSDYWLLLQTAVSFAIAIWFTAAFVIYMVLRVWQ